MQVAGNDRHQIHEEIQLISPGEEYTDAKLSDVAFFDIMSDIIGAEGNSFERIIVPEQWCETSSWSQAIDRLFPTKLICCGE